MAQSPSTDAEFRRIYDEHFAAVRSYCLRRLPLADANDAVSEVFLVAWRKRSDMPVGVEVLPWLFAVARNVVRNTQRASRRMLRLRARVKAEPVYADHGPEARVVRSVADQELLDAVAGLDLSDQEVIRLRAWEGLSAPQIGTVLGCSTAAAEKRVARALKRLEAAITKPRRRRNRPRAVAEGGER